ncbi:MAG: LCCL domain-containing protein [Luteolibacter sp.]
MKAKPLTLLRAALSATFGKFLITAAAFIFISELRGQVSPSGLVSYYTFDDSTADDKSATVGGSASANNGLWTGAPIYRTGIFGNAAQVGNGAGTNYIVADGANEFLFGSATSFTVIYWINVESDVASDPAVVAGGGKDWSSSGSTRGWVSAISGDDMDANVGDGTNRADPATIDLDPDDFLPDGTDHWTFVALVVDREDQTITSYVADRFVPANSINWEAGVGGKDFGPDTSEPTSASIAGVGNLTGTNTTIVLGQDGDLAGYSLPPTGIDDLSVWNRALSRSELWQIYANGRMDNALEATLAIPSEVRFQPATGQPLFESGNVNLFKQVGFDVADHVGKTVSIPILGDFGGEIDAEFEAKFGLEVGMCLGGIADYDLRFAPAIILPDKYPSGVALPLTVQENLRPGSHFVTTLPPLGQVYADVIFHAYADIDAEACVFSCFDPLGFIPFPLSICKPPISPGINNIFKESVRCDPALNAPVYCAMELASFNRNLSNKVRWLNVGAGSVSNFINQPFVEITPPISFSRTFSADPNSDAFSISPSNPFENGSLVTVSSTENLPSGLEERSLYFTIGTGSTIQLGRYEGGGAVDIFDGGSGVLTMNSADEPTTEGIGQYGSIDFSVPIMITDSADSPATNTAQVLKSTATKTVLASSVDLAGVISEIISQIPLVEIPPLKEEASLGPIHLGYTLAELEFKPTVQLQMDFEMTWNLEVVDMIFSRPVELHFHKDAVPSLLPEQVVSDVSRLSEVSGFAPGDINLTNLGAHSLPRILLPTIGSPGNYDIPQPPVHVEIEYRLLPKLKTIVSIPINGPLPYEILSASASIDRVGGLRLGPLKEGTHKFKIGEFTAYDRSHELARTDIETLNFTMQAAGPPSFDWNPDQNPNTTHRWREIDANPNHPPESDPNLSNWLETVGGTIKSSYPGLGDASSRATINAAAFTGPTLGGALPYPIQSLSIESDRYLIIEADPYYESNGELVVNGLVENHGSIIIEGFKNPSSLKLDASETVISGAEGQIVLKRGGSLLGNAGPEPFGVCNYNSIIGSGNALNQHGVNPAGSMIHNLGSFVADGSADGGGPRNDVQMRLSFPEHPGGPDTVSWELFDVSGTLVDSDGPYDENTPSPLFDIFESTSLGLGLGLPPGDYTFKLYDSAGIGASVLIIDGSGNVLVDDPGFNFSQTFNFSVSSAGELTTSAERMVNEGNLEAKKDNVLRVKGDRLDNLLVGNIQAVEAGGIVAIEVDQVEHAGFLKADNGGTITISGLTVPRATWDAGQSYRLLTQGSNPAENCGRFLSTGGSFLNFFSTDFNGGCFVANVGGTFGTSGCNFSGSVIQLGTFDEFKTGQATSYHFFSGGDVLEDICYTNYATIDVLGDTRFENTKLFANHGTILVEAGATLDIRKNTVASPGETENAVFLPGIANVTDDALVGGTWDIVGTLLIEGASIKTIGGNVAQAYISSGSIGEGPGATLEQQVEVETQDVDLDGIPDLVLDPDSERNLSRGTPATVSLIGSGASFPALNSLAMNLGELNITGGASFAPSGTESDPSNGISAGDFCNKNKLVIEASSSLDVLDTFVQSGKNALTQINGDGAMMSQGIELRGGRFEIGPDAQVLDYSPANGGTLQGPPIRVIAPMFDTGLGSPTQPLFRAERAELVFPYPIQHIAVGAEVWIEGGGLDPFGARFDALTEHVVSNAGVLTFKGDGLDNRIDIELATGGVFTNTGELRILGHDTKLRMPSFVQNGANASTRIGAGAILQPNSNPSFNAGKLIFEIDGRERQCFPGEIKGALNSFGGELVIDFVNFSGGAGARPDMGDTWQLVDGGFAVDSSLITNVGCLLEGEVCQPGDILPLGTHLEAFWVNPSLQRGLIVRVIPDGPGGLIEFNDWAAANGITNPNSFLADPFSDTLGLGFLNAAGFAFGLDGTNRPFAQTELNLVTLDDDTFMEIDFIRPYGTDAEYVLWVSPDLATWQEAHVAVMPSSGSAPGAGLELVKFRSIYPWATYAERMFAVIAPTLRAAQFDIGEIPNNPIQYTGGMDNFNAQVEGESWVAEPEKVLFLKVTGLLAGGGGDSPVAWGGTTTQGGSERNFIYRDRSKIGEAVVHAGLLGVGEQGVIKVTFLPPQNTYFGSPQNGTSRTGSTPDYIRTKDYNGDGSNGTDSGPDGPYCYKVELVRSPY